MKILVLSDSHREETALLSAVKEERPDAVIHLGDHAADAQILAYAYPHLPICVVRGNCDRDEAGVPEEAVIEWESVRLFATHGHRYHVKSGLLALRYAAMEKEARVVLFGHTHIPYCEEENGLWMLNPGACGRLFPTYGLIEIKNGTAACRVVEGKL